MIRQAGLILCLSAATSLASLVRPDNQISDADARSEYVRALTASKTRDREALQVVNAFLKDAPQDTELLRMRADLNFRLKNLSAAEKDLRTLARLNPENRKVALELANVLAARGHARESRTWFENALRSQASDAELRLYAAQRQGWGDFGGAEQELKRQFEKHGRTIPLLFEWAALQRGQQRFVEAEETYREILRPLPRSLPAWQGLSVTSLLAKDYDSAVASASEGLKWFPKDKELLNVRATALSRLGETEKAARDHRELAEKGRAEGWLGLGKAATPGSREAITSFKNAAAKDPLTSAYFLESTKANFPRHLPVTVENFTRWGHLCLEEGHSEAAISAFSRALQVDPEHFPAAMGLVEARASAKHYEEALAELESLRTQFPKNFKLDLTRARILSWSKNYEESVAAYDDLLINQPGHPVVLREQARVNAWSKSMRAATRDYARLWESPVDEKLKMEIADPFPRDGRSPYDVYELLDTPDASQSTRRVLEKYRADYRIQKAAWLESRAKNQAWNRHYLRAEDTLDELTAFEAGNQEARFDLAQAQAVQQLRRRTVGTYEGLLALDPIHQQAGLAMEREDILDSPALSTNYLILDEKGTDRVADITRQRIQISLEIPWQKQTQFKVSSITWLESPDRFSNTYTAIGPGLEWTSVFNEYWTGSASFAYKNYLDPGIQDTFAGSAALAFNAWDFVTLTAAYDHADVIHNAYAIEQSTQADSIQLAAKSFINHWFELQALNTVRFYNDNNTGFEGLYTAGLILLDHPHTLKLVLGGEYRDTARQSESIFENGREVNVIHPYWTPQNYARGLVSLEWRHDLSRFFFANAETHYYALRVRGSYDSDSNPSIGGEVEWRMDFAKRWTIHVLASIERSPQWNGAGGFTSLTCRF